MRVEAMSNTSEQYKVVQDECRALYVNKMKDYGNSWRVLRPRSLTDQIYIKARRIRSIEEKGEMMINEGIRAEYIGIINYSIMALIQLESPQDEPDTTETREYLAELYDKHFYETRALMDAKNHDYDEAWREMRLSSLTDIILMKLNRIKQIEDNEGRTFVSEGLSANYADIINYAVFAMIKLNEK